MHAVFNDEAFSELSLDRRIIKSIALFKRHEFILPADNKQDRHAQVLNPIDRRPKHSEYKFLEKLQKREEHVDKVGNARKRVFKYNSFNLILNAFCELDGYCAAEGAADEEDFFIIYAWVGFGPGEHGFCVAGDAGLARGALRVAVAAVADD